MDPNEKRCAKCWTAPPTGAPLLAVAVQGDHGILFGNVAGSTGTSVLWCIACVMKHHTMQVTIG